MAHSFKTLTQTMFLKLKYNGRLCQNDEGNFMSPDAVPTSVTTMKSNMHITTMLIKQSTARILSLKRL